jgi:hypothetical protein
MPTHRDGVSIDNAEDVVGVDLAEQRDEGSAEITSRRCDRTVEVAAWAQA